MSLRRVIFHVDMDAFYAAIEQRENPSYRGKPVIVGAKPGKRGVVSTASYEARTFGIHSAMPINEAYSRCPGGIFVQPQMALYDQVSRQIFDLFEKFTPLVEPVSVDEAFLDMSGTEKLFGPMDLAAKRISDALKREQNLTGSIGVAPNKFLAKIASDCNKPDGITIVPFERQAVLEWLAPMHVNRIWGVGKKSAVVLQTLGIYTIGDLQQVPHDILIRHFGKVGNSLFSLCRGIDDRLVETGDAAKSISRETTFNRDSSDRLQWRQVVYELAQDVALRARQSNVKGATIVLTWRLSDFSRHSKRITITQPTNLARIIFEHALVLMGSVHERALRLIGVGLTGLTNEVQEDLFSGSDGQQRLEVSEVTADTIRSRFGFESLKKGREIKPGEKLPLRMKKENSNIE
ncbi:MAG: DNA polymerase IV [Chitinispirillaceae bacterium]|nr:DNA polymerase IV [Chitinispirillaceae bacterium]